MRSSSFLTPRTERKEKQKWPVVNMNVTHVLNVNGVRVDLGANTQTRPYLDLLGSDVHPQRSN